MKGLHYPSSARGVQHMHLHYYGNDTFLWQCCNDFSQIPTNTSVQSD